MQTNSTIHVSENSSPINVSAATWSLQNYDSKVGVVFPILDIEI